MKIGHRGMILKELHTSTPVMAPDAIWTDSRLRAPNNARRAARTAEVSDHPVRWYCRHILL
jgi:hypothetical protein